jgi:hypothetical protein
MAKILSDLDFFDWVPKRSQNWGRSVTGQNNYARYKASQNPSTLPVEPPGLGVRANQRVSSTENTSSETVDVSSARCRRKREP